MLLLVLKLLSSSLMDCRLTVDLLCRNLATMSTASVAPYFAVSFEANAVCRRDLTLAVLLLLLHAAVLQLQAVAGRFCCAIPMCSRCSLTVMQLCSLTSATFGFTTFLRAMSAALTLFALDDSYGGN
jgi:hypothetical protein